MFLSVMPSHKLMMLREAVKERMRWKIEGVRS